MRFSSKFISFLLAMLMVLSTISLISCNNNNDNPDDTTLNVDDTTAGDNTTDDTAKKPDTDTENPDPAPQDLKMVSDGTSYVTVVRSDEAEVGSVAVKCAMNIRTAIQEATKVSPKLVTDWIKRGEEHDPQQIEILVGVTNYKESQKSLADISYGEYVVKVVGNKLVIAAYSNNALFEACAKVKKYINENVINGNLVIPAGLYYEGVTDADLNSLPAYENGMFDCTYLCGNNGTLIYIKGTTRAAYDKYLEKLQKNGWNKYTTNDITENSFGTFTNSKYTLNVGYYDYEHAARLIIEPLADPVPFESANKYTQITTSQITMIGTEHSNSSGDVYSNGESFLIRLNDGRFIVIDGGFNRTNSAMLLLNAIKEQSKDYIKAGQKPTVAAWIITHAHGDHSGMIGKQYGHFRGINIEQFLVNFMSDAERNKAINSTQYKGNWGGSEGSGWKDVIDAAKFLHAKVQNVHVGQVFYFADIKLEILYTIESFAPKLCNAFNTTSLIIKMTFKSGDTFMMTGDATGNAMEIAAKMYGDYLKVDMVQVSHHGYTTWGNDYGTMRAYKLMAPSTLLWPQGSTAFPNYKDKVYNKVLFSPEHGGGNKNFKECLVSGLEGEMVTVPIPYTPGNYIEKRIK